ncbi:MAG: succinate dehydrogenase/fumarate reductase iron-sulfur subunit [Candidatus Thorarchaeota archaeon]
MIFRIARSRDGGAITHYDLYKIQERKGMTILDALFQIQDRMDSSLAFRYSCRGAVCGSCAMLINKEPRLACRTQVSSIHTEPLNLRPFPSISETPQGWDHEKEILIEPLPNFPILKDLVVDMTKFYDTLKELRLWADPVSGETSRFQSPEDREVIRRYVNCILCAICYGSCPVNFENEDYVGPAALAKAYRFNQDSRSPDAERYLNDAKGPHGAPLCDLVMNCVKACPKGVAPGGAIRKMKE